VDVFCWKKRGDKGKYLGGVGLRFYYIWECFDKLFQTSTLPTTQQHTTQEEMVRISVVSFVFVA